LKMFFLLLSDFIYLKNTFCPENINPPWFIRIIRDIPTL